MLELLALSLAAATAMRSGDGANPPFACKVDALDKAQRQRQQALLARVREVVRGTQELSDGLVLSFPADPGLFVMLAEWISLERRCCPFMEFSLEWKRDEAVCLRLTGQPGIKEFIAAEMGLTAAR
jgi:hypothetical protein